MPTIPRHASAQSGNVVAIARDNGDERNVRHAQFFRKLKILGGDFRKYFFREVDEVHFVHGKHDVLDAELKHNVAMPSRLRQDSLARIDQQDRKLGCGRAARHVARVLLVARRVGHNERPSRGREVAIGDIDGDALLALGLEPVHEKRQVDAARCAKTLTILLNSPELIVRDKIAIVKETADEGAFAVIDAAARQKAQNAFLLLRGQVLMFLRVRSNFFLKQHQK